MLKFDAGAAAPNVPASWNVCPTDPMLGPPHPPTLSTVTTDDDNSDSERHRVERASVATTEPVDHFAKFLYVVNLSLTGREDLRSRPSGDTVYYAKRSKKPSSFCCPPLPR